MHNDELVQAMGTELVKQAADTVARPALTLLGEDVAALYKVLRLPLFPIRALATSSEHVEQWLMEALFKRLKDMKPDEVHPPQPRVAQQALLQLTLCFSEHELREMFVNLLASSMTEHADKVHPSFTEVIHQLSADEAKVLRYAKTNPLSFNERYTTSAGPQKQRTTEPIELQFESYCQRAGVEQLHKHPVYLDNLTRLRLIERESGERARIRGGIAAPLHSGFPVISDVHVVFLSDFGRTFIDLCV